MVDALDPGMLGPTCKSELFGPQKLPMASCRQDCSEASPNCCSTAWAVESVGNGVKVPRPEVTAGPTAPCADEVELGKGTSTPAPHDSKTAS